MRSAGCPLERPTQDEVNLADRRRRERLTDVRTTLIVTVVLLRGAVINAGPSVAVQATAPELGVEAVEDVAVQCADLY